MNVQRPHITVCVCTLQRPDLLRRLLEDLVRQQTADAFTFSIAVADNDPEGSARPIVDSVAAASSVPMDYLVEPRRSISHARNRSLEPARGEYVAFIDDDEFPPPDWLATMLRALRQQAVSGVFGPVRPAYDPAAPDWVKKAGFYERPEHPTGYRMPWQECRTGNVLIERRILNGLDPVFRAEFGGGASDMDLFRRLMEAGHVFSWCQEGALHEVVPLGRCRRGFLIRRALLRGALSLRHPKGRGLNVAKGFVAVVAYPLALPWLQLRGHHLFMRYLVRWFDHLGRVLAVFGIRPVSTREMQ